MKKSANRRGEKMLLAIALWLCILPLAVLLVVPVWGVSAVWLAALASLLAVLAVCWSYCGWRAFHH